MKKFKKIKSERERKRVARAARGRKKIQGTEEKPRLVITKTNRNIFAQAINDSEFSTLAAANTLNFGKNVNNCSLEKAVKLGEQVGGLLLEKGFKTVVFDRAGRQYTGVVKAFCDAVRNAGVHV